MIKIRAWDGEAMVYPEPGGLTSGDLLNRYDNTMLFANKKDKHGNDIWEKDCVDIDGHSYWVKMDWEQGQFVLISKGSEYNGFSLQFYAAKCVVVGHFYDPTPF
jgi:hypothetical protein